MAPRESIYADKLRELGFRKKTRSKAQRLASREVERLILGRNLSVKERLSATRMFSMRPSFAREPEITPPITAATDETGQLWEAEGHIDLTPLGFLDNVEFAKEFLGWKTPPNYPVKSH